MSTSWQWFPETKTAICCYCSFSTTYTGEFPGDIKHDCDPALHPPIETNQGLKVGRSPRSESLSRASLEQLLACGPSGSGPSPGAMRNLWRHTDLDLRR